MRNTIVLGVVLAAGSAWAAPDKALYELQERCGEKATAWFKHEYNATSSSIQTTKDGTTITTFRNHYNPRLNACIVLETANGFSKKGSKVVDPWKSETIFDLNENNELGAYMQGNDNPKPFQCYLYDSQCSSKEDFDGLVKKLMSE